MLTQKQTDGGNYLFATAEGRAMWLTKELAESHKSLKPQVEAVGCPYTGNTCTRLCAAIRLEGNRIECWAIAGPVRGESNGYLLAKVKR